MKTPSSPLDILLTRQRQTQFWFALFLLTLLVSLWDRSRLMAAFTQDTRYVIMDETAFYLPRTLDFPSAVDLHSSQVVLAMEALFDRNPRTLDHPERLKRLFSKDAAKQVARTQRAEANAFAAKQIHQKVEIGAINLLETTDQAVIATAEGQLIRNGIFDGQGFTEVHAVRARFTFTRNDQLVFNGGFPTIVTQLETDITPQKS